jgi:aminoglycoside phosphotransferase (APT) family kinase protein
MNGEGDYGDFDVRKTLERYLKARFPEREEFVLLQTEKLRLSASHNIFVARANWKDGNESVSEDLIVRVEPDRGVHQSYDIGRECETVKKMLACGVPVPRIYCLEKDSAVLGHPFVVMEKIEGERLIDAWIRQPELRPQLMEDLVSVLATIHDVDWRANDLSFLGEPQHDLGYAEDEIGKWERVLEETQYHAYPVMAELIAWLRRNVPVSQRTTMCHGDYSILNAHVNKGRIAAILDWEMVSLGDPVSDIVWLCNMAAGMRLPDWDEDRFIKGYEEVTGTRVSEASLTFWRKFAFLKTMGIMVSGTRAFIESKDPSMNAMFNFYMLSVATQDVAAKSLGY